MRSHSHPARLRTVAFQGLATCEALELQLESNAREERDVSDKLGHVLTALALAREQSYELAAQKRSLLQGIKDTRTRLGEEILVVKSIESAEAECVQAEKAVSRSVGLLEKKLWPLRETAAGLRDEEETERSRRRRFREAAREELQFEEAASASYLEEKSALQANAELCAAGYNSEHVQRKWWQQRETDEQNAALGVLAKTEEGAAVRYWASQMQERAALREASELRIAVQRQEASTLMQVRKREEFHRQLQKLVEVDGQLHEEHNASRERLMRQQLRQRDRQKSLGVTLRSGLLVHETRPRHYR